VPFRWREIFQRENELAKAKVSEAIDEHADPKAQLNLAIRELQDQHDKLEHACAVVIAEANTLGNKLQRDMAQQANLESQARAALAAGHQDAAQAIALQIVAVRNLIASEQPAYDQAKAAADQAQQAFRDNTDQLHQKMAEAQQLAAEIDQAAMQHNINESMKAVTSATSHVIPSFDQVRDKVNARLAEEQADAALTGGLGGDSTQVHNAHLAQQAAADEVLASLGIASAASPAPTAPSGTSRKTSGSPMDAL